MNTCLKQLICAVCFLSVTATVGAKETVWLNPGDVPTYNWEEDIRYRVNYDDGVGAIMYFGDGYDENAGTAFFDIDSLEERINTDFRWHETRRKEYKTNIKVWLDKTLFIEDIRLDPYLAKYLVMLPYPAKLFEAEGTLSSGKKHTITAKLGTIPRVKKDFDLRMHPGIFPTKDWNKVYAGGGGGRNLVRKCVSSPENGPLKRMRVTLKKHPLFAPEGDRIIGELTFHMPVYEFYSTNFWFLSELRPPETRTKEDAFTLEAECETRKGVMFRSTKKVIIPAIIQHQWGSQGPYIMSE